METEENPSSELALEPSLSVKLLPGTARNKSINKFISYLNDIELLAGEQMPAMMHIQLKKGLRRIAQDCQRNKVYIPPGLFCDKKDVIEEFLATGNLSLTTTDISWYYRLWNEHFPHLEMKTWIPFTKCQECVDLIAAYMLCTSDEQRLALKGSKILHRCENALTRARCHLRMDTAVKLPNVYLVLIMDGMDNAKTCVPSQAVTSKDVEGAGQPLKTQLVGVLAPGHGFYGAITIPRQQHGSSLAISVLLKSIREIEVQGRLKHGPTYKLPPVLIFQADNCGRENKNRQMIAFLSILIEMGVFMEIQMHFLPVGHTHCQIDQLFSVVYKNLKGSDVFTIDHLMAIVSSLFGKKGWNVNELVTDVLDMDAMSDNIMQKFVGLGTARDPETKKKISLHSVQLKKMSPGSRGLSVGLKYRRRDQGSEWIGHWRRPDEAIAVFLPGKTVVDLPAVILPGRRHAIADIQQLDERYTALFRMFDTAVARAQHGVPDGPSTSVTHHQQVCTCSFVFGIFDTAV
jgi:hypothetical protein